MFHIPTMLKSSQSTQKKDWFLSFNTPNVSTRRLSCFFSFLFFFVFFPLFFFRGKVDFWVPQKFQRLQAALDLRYWTFCRLTSTVLWVFVLQDSWQQLVMSHFYGRVLFIFLLKSWGLPAFCTKKNKHRGRFIVDSWEVGERSTCFFWNHSKHGSFAIENSIQNPTFYLKQD